MGFVECKGNDFFESRAGRAEVFGAGTENPGFFVGQLPLTDYYSPEWLVGGRISSSEWPPHGGIYKFRHPRMDAWSRFSGNESWGQKDRSNGPLWRLCWKPSLLHNKYLVLVDVCKKWMKGWETDRRSTNLYVSWWRHVEVLIDPDRCSQVGPNLCVFCNSAWVTARSPHLFRLCTRLSTLLRMRLGVYKLLHFGSN